MAVQTYVKQGQQQYHCLRGLRKAHAKQKTRDNKGIMRVNSLQIRVQHLVIQYQMVSPENKHVINITDTSRLYLGIYQNAVIFHL